MSERFGGKVAIVTGGVSGIGAAITARLIDEGASVVVGDINEELVDRVWQQYGSSAVGVVADVTKEADVEALVTTAVQRYGQLNHSFQVAGGSRNGLITELSDEAWDFTIRLNLYSTFYGTKHAARQMAHQGTPGSIVNVASLNSRVPMFFGVAYSAAKAAAVMVTRQAALELGEKGIRVNAVSPGLVDTPLTRGLLEIPGARDAYLERIPANRAATPEDIAAAALYLASDDAAYITGENLVVDGGWAQTAYPDLRPFLT